MTDDLNDSDRPNAEVYRPPAGTPAWHGDERDDLSLVYLLNVLLRHRWKVVGVPVVLTVLVIGATIVWPSSFTSEASIIPQTGEGMSGQIAQLSGVASQFGINVPGGQPGQSPQFYADLLTSRRLLEEAVTFRYRRDSATGTDAVDGALSFDSAGSTLVELYGVDARVPAAAVDGAARRLEESITVSTNTETGVVELSVTTPWPAVSRQVADRLIELVNDFNNRVRQSQAAAEAEFVGDRLDEARRELRAAEDSLETFLQRNVGWQQSPELRFRHDRLQRTVNLKQQVYTSLASRYEEARISEVKSTPVVTTVTRPQVPVRPDSGNLPLKAAITVLLGTMIGVLWAFGGEFTDRIEEEESEDYRTFRSLTREAVNDLRQARRSLRGLVGGRLKNDES